jgi:SpoVK/Ycf46/Vps4 family AAA+-type ATPase
MNNLLPLNKNSKNSLLSPLNKNSKNISLSSSNIKITINKNKNYRKRSYSPLNLNIELPTKRKKEIKKEYKIIDEEINTLDDLIKIGKLYNTKYDTTKYEYNINLKILNDLIEPLNKLYKMVGLTNIKEDIFNKIILHLQKLEDINNNMLHTVIYGEPGTGKTCLSVILGQIYTKLGLLSKGTFKNVKRNDLIAEYLGQTTIKTYNLLESCKGGVLLIDEAYSLGNNEGRDSFSKEAIDTLTRFLSENKSDFMCIIAGYKDSLEKCFFSYNRGLERRFPFRYKLNSYDGTELKNIFINIILDNNWFVKLDNNYSISFFNNNTKYLQYNGGDLENLFYFCKLVHAKRVLKLNQNVKKIINNIDLKNGFNLYLNSDSIKDRKIDTIKSYTYSMYL